ncbi:MAG: HNH endonuclease family protein [Propionicimonas sp.]|uniref:HNH endonuclease family protein n=1 Tax=Propionicimonas sp. TaxID=1955623 RepID=UPI003D0F16E6
MRRTRHRRLLYLVLALVLVVLGVLVMRGWPPAAGTGAGADQSAQPAGNTLLTSSAAEVTTARTQLDGLVVGPRPALSTDYRRAAFGDAWTDTDGNGCNQRDDVLLRDRVASAPYRVGQQGSCDHDVLAGTWVDPYTGATIVLTDAKDQKQAQSVQIDHVVALSVAWRYGASTWTDERRLAFANDLRNLVAAGGAANQAKGGSDASEWQPVRGARCGYAVRYVTVKAAYSLPTDATEKEALAAMLDTCGPS